MMYSQYPHDTETGQNRSREKEKNIPWEAKQSCGKPAGVRAPGRAGPGQGQGARALPFPVAAQGWARSRGQQSAHLRGGRGGGKPAPGCAGVGRVGSACATPPPRITPETAGLRGREGRERQAAAA